MAVLFVLFFLWAQNIFQHLFIALKYHGVSFNNTLAILFSFSD